MVCENYYKKGRDYYQMLKNVGKDLVERELKGIIGEVQALIREYLVNCLEWNDEAKHKFLNDKRWGGMTYYYLWYLAHSKRPPVKFTSLGEKERDKWYKMAWEFVEKTRYIRILPVEKSKPKKEGETIEEKAGLLPSELQGKTIYIVGGLLLLLLLIFFLIRR